LPSDGDSRVLLKLAGTSYHGEAPMRQEALKMIVGMIATAVLVTAIIGSPLPLIVVAAASYAIWQVARSLDR